MIAHRDFRRLRTTDVTLHVTLSEFHDIVEWMELEDPHGRAPAEWRAELDRIDPPEAANAV